MIVIEPRLHIALIGLFLGSMALGPGSAYGDGKAQICPQCNQDGTWNPPPQTTYPNPVRPSNLTPSKPSAAQVRAANRKRLNELGMSAKQRGDLSTAISHFQTALELDPNNGDIRRNLAYTQNDLALQISNRGDHATAVGMLEDAVRLVPENNIVRKNLKNTRKKLEAEQQKGRDKAQLNQAKRAIGGMLKDLANTWDVSNSATSSNASDGLSFAGSGEAVRNTNRPSKGLEFAQPAGLKARPSHQDASVVDLRFLDPNKPKLLDPRTAKGQTKVVRLSSVQREKLRDSVKSSNRTNGERQTKILLDALEIGKADWGTSRDYLKDARRRFPKDPAIRDATATLLGISSSFSYYDRGFPADDPGVGMLGPVHDAKGLDYDTRALLQRAKAKIADAMTSADWEVVHKLYKQAHERSPDQERIRDWVNYTKGVIIGLTTIDP